MHMNSAPHLLNQDRPEFERVLDEALRTADAHPEIARVAQRFNPAQLRTLATGATIFITAAATAEYQHYVNARERSREPARISTEPRSENGETPTEATPNGIAAALSEVTESAGAGATAMVAVLAPLLAAVAAVIFLLAGYLLKLLTPEPAIASGLLTAGWVFAVLAALGILIAGAALLFTALRNNSSAKSSEDGSGLAGETPEVAAARAAWHQALLEKGLLPFFRDLDDAPRTEAGHVPAHPGPTPPSQQRMPRLGYHRPGFSGPESDGESGTRPRYSSPDFSSPDYGGPDHRPE
ncbi:hypothetical protein AB0J21_30115 [Streptomyces sp. NPDC049954]|uniref:hypothetical protein n=1 Tax=Streptomyces sp. NPDC049954 TaxID=3155779 RepID=UPI0034188570